MRRQLAFVVIVVATAASACTASPSTSPSPANSPARGGPHVSPMASASGYHPVIDPANFVETVDNPYFPLEPGTVFFYKGTSDGEVELDTVTVTDKRKTILGVDCVVVRDEVTTADGQPIERTFDWYAQDEDGNVWYFGEDTKEYNEKGKVVSTEGSWEAGVDGAEPGILMEANPAVGHSHREEYYRGHAEDMFWTLDLNGEVSVPFGSYDDALLTVEWTRLEPKIFGEKYYATGVGLILEVNVAGHEERSELVQVRTS